MLLLTSRNEDEVMLHVVHLMCVAAHRRPRTRLPQSGGSVCDCLSARQSKQSSGMGMVSVGREYFRSSSTARSCAMRQ
eukprot:6903176-Prymnesium_polylepis.1